jgi:hypothetical protein
MHNAQCRIGDLPNYALCILNCALFFGRPSRDRTCDPRIKSPLLYRLSYRPKKAIWIIANKVVGCQLPVVSYLFVVIE